MPHTLTELLFHRDDPGHGSTDPRHNPNLNRDQNDPEFWYHAARKPFNKAKLHEDHSDVVTFCEVKWMTFPGMCLILAFD